MRSRFAAISLAFFIVTAASARSAPEQIELLNSNEWPTTVEDTVRDILSHMPPADTAGLRRMEKEQLILYHHGWGTDIRNRYGLWRGNDQLVLAACGYFCHPDDASMKIMEAVWQRLRQ